MLKSYLSCQPSKLRAVPFNGSKWVRDHVPVCDNRGWHTLLCASHLRGYGAALCALKLLCVIIAPWIDDIATWVGWLSRKSLVGSCMGKIVDFTMKKGLNLERNSQLRIRSWQLPVRWEIFFKNLCDTRIILDSCNPPTPERIFLHCVCSFEIWNKRNDGILMLDTDWSPVLLY